MPPSAAPEWLRVGCSFETIATSAPASWAAIAARIPAQPAPITRTSCFPSTERASYRNSRGSAVGPGVSAAGGGRGAGRRPRLPARPSARRARARGGCSPRNGRAAQASSSVSSPSASSWPSDARARGCGRGVDALELREVVAEHGRKLARLHVVSGGIAPRPPRVEEPRLDARRLARELEAEDGVLAERDVVQLPREHRVQEPARGRDRHPLALAERPAGPAGVHEPDVGAVPLELLSEHARVDGWR